jgi:hypothetical protein
MKLKQLSGYDDEATEIQRQFINNNYDSTNQILIKTYNFALLKFR